MMKISRDEVKSVKVTDSPSPEQENNNMKIVKSVYKALRDGETKKLAANLSGTELEWWYHGPRHCQYMMEMLTGKSTTTTQNNNKGFKFRPRRMRAIGDRAKNVIIVEGWEGKGEYYYWVHLWRLKDDGVIAQLREYFNTLITLVVRDSEDGGGGGGDVRLWRSTSLARAQGWLPDLVVAI